MKIVPIIVALSVVSGLPAHAQETKRQPFADLAPYLVMVGGNVADIVTTGQCFQRGTCHEGNGLTDTKQIGPLALQKASFTFAVAMTMHLLQAHGHPKAARIVGYLDGGVTFGVAAHNTRVAR